MSNAVRAVLKLTLEATLGSEVPSSGSFRPLLFFLIFLL